MDKKNVSKSGPEISLSHTTAILRIPGVLGVFSVFDVADCVLGTKCDVTIAKKKRGEKTRGSASIAPHFWRLPLSVLYRRPGEMVWKKMTEPISIPSDAHRAGGICY